MEPGDAAAKLIKATMMAVKNATTEAARNATTEATKNAASAPHELLTGTSNHHGHHKLFIVVGFVAGFIVLLLFVYVLCLVSRCREDYLRKKRGLIPGPGARHHHQQASSTGTSSPATELIFASSPASSTVAAENSFSVPVVRVHR